MLPPPPRFFVSVAAKGLSWGVSLLFATLAGSFISVAAKALKGMVGSGPWTVVSGEKRGGWGMGNPSGLHGTGRGLARGRGWRLVRVLSDASGLPLRQRASS